MTLADVYTRLGAAIRAAGSQEAFATKHGLSLGYVNDVLHARRQPSAAILAALGLRAVTTYVEVRRSADAAGR